MWDLTCPFILHSMPQVLDIGFFDSDFVHSSNQYNNDKPVRGASKMINPPEVMVGSLAIMLCECVVVPIIFFPSSERRGGIQYFLHDGRSARGDGTVGTWTRAASQ